MKKKKETNTLLSTLATVVIALMMAAVSYIAVALYIMIVVALIGSIVMGIRLMIGLSAPIDMTGATLLFGSSLVAILIYNLIYTRIDTGKWRLRWRSFYSIIADLAIPGM